MASRRTPLEANQIAEALEGLPGWSLVDATLHKAFRFAHYRAAVGFTVRVAFEAEAANHHPTLTVEYSRVTVTTCTHDAGNQVTAMDVALAGAIEKLYSEG